MSYLMKLPAFFGLIAMAMFASGPAAALPNEAFYSIYYYDAAHTQYAGFRTMGCSRASNGEGEMTLYAEREVLMQCTTPRDCDVVNIGFTFVCLGV